MILQIAVAQLHDHTARVEIEVDDVEHSDQIGALERLDYPQLVVLDADARQALDCDLKFSNFPSLLTKDISTIHILKICSVLANLTFRLEPRSQGLRSQGHIYKHFRVQCV